MSVKMMEDIDAAAAAAEPNKHSDSGLTEGLIGPIQLPGGRTCSLPAVRCTRRGAVLIRATNLAAALTGVDLVAAPHKFQAS